MGCPARYDRQSEVYVVDFQWNVPFSPAALSHIELLRVHADVLLNLTDGVNGYTLLRPRVFEDTLPVNVSYIYIYIYIIFCSHQTMYYNNQCSFNCSQTLMMSHTRLQLNYLHLKIKMNSTNLV